MIISAFVTLKERIIQKVFCSITNLEQTLHHNPFVSLFSELFNKSWIPWKLFL